MEQAAADLKGLIDLNPTPPYLLAVHVREFSDETRVAQIVQALRRAADVELLPAHEWI